MINLSSFPKPLNVVVIGASGGIGKAFVAMLQSHDQVGVVYSFSRNDPNAISIDICNEGSIQKAVSNIDEPVHLIILATGLLHDGDVMPEKSLRDLNAENMKKLFDINTIGPTLVAKHFISCLPRTGKSVFAVLSARVGSISDNHLGGWHSYRSSKAALNMMIKNIAIETSRKYKDMAIIGLHPGTVDTKLSSPFQTNVKEGKLFSPNQAAEYLLNVINRVSCDDTGRIFAWDGQEVKP